MGCDLRFIVNGESIVVENTTITQQSSLEDVAKYLMNKISLKQLIREKLISTKSNNEPLIILQNETGLIPNFTCKVLINKYPWKNWKNVDESLKILAVTNYQAVNNYGLTIFGPVILSDGTIVVNINEDLDVNVVNNYLRRKYKLEHLEELEDPNAVQIINLLNLNTGLLKELEKVKKSLAKYRAELQELSDKETKTDKELQKIKQLSKKPYRLLDIDLTASNLLLSFILDSALYKDLFYQGQSVYSILKNYSKQFDGIEVKTYDDSWTNKLNESFESVNFLQTISINNLNKLIDEKLSEKNIPEDLKNNILKNKEYSDEDKLAYLQELTKLTDLDFSYIPYLIKGNTVYFKNLPRTFIQLYDDFEIKTFNSLIPVQVSENKYNYKGFHIYKWKNKGKEKYIFSKGIISEYSYASKLFNTIEEVYKQIDLKVKNKAQSSYFDIHLNNDYSSIYTPEYLTPGTIIEVLDTSNLVLPKKIENTQINNILANNGLTYGKLAKFILDTYNISIELDLDTSEKAKLFLLLMDSGKYSTEEAINTINSLGYNYYYVESTKDYNGRNFSMLYFTILNNARVQSKLYNIKLHKVKFNDEIRLYKPKYDNNLLVITKNILNNLCSLLKDKFGVQYEILTLDELLDKFPNLKLEANKKAFIKDGVIYINSSNATSKDVFHEYAHIFLGILKSNNYDVYEKLMNKIGELEASKKARYKLTYENMADLDINEEIFANLFAGWVSNRKVNDIFSKDLKEVKKLIEKDIKSIFEKDTDEDIFNGDIWEIVSEFTTNINLLPETDNGLLIPSDVSTYRQASNWIRNLIADGKITEDC